VYHIPSAVSHSVDVQRPPPPTPEGLPVVLAFLPLHHTYGLHTYSFRIFLAPMTLVFMKRWDIEVALTAIPRFGYPSYR
jgi:hypothetical protein